MNACLVQGGLTTLAATALLIGSTATHAAPPQELLPVAQPAKRAPRGGGIADGGIAGFGGGGGPCEYALDDGIAEQNVGFAGVGYQGSVNGFTADGACPTVNVIRVAWGTLNASPTTSASLAIYGDPNNDGDPTDVTAADLIVQVFGVTANAGTNTFNNYPIPDTVLPDVFFVAAVALSAGSGAGDFPMRNDLTTNQGASYFVAGIADPEDPVGSASTLALNSAFGAQFGGNLMVRVANSETAGDECTDCFNVVEGTWARSTANLTGSTGDDTSCAAGDTIDAWYCYTASCDGMATATLCEGTEFDTTLAVFTACDGDEIACDDDGCGPIGGPSVITWAVTAGTTYRVRVSGWNGDSGNYTLTISCESTLLNDDCADALPIFDGLTPFNTNDATTDGPASPADTCNDFGSPQTHNDIWYDYVAVCDGTLLVTTCSNLGGTAGYDTDLVVYDGIECPVTLDRLLACNDDDPNNSCGTGAPFASTIMVPVVAGQSYKIRVGGWGLTDRGPGELLIDCMPPNDLCEDAAPIFDGLTPYDTSGANTDGPANPVNTCNDFGSNQTHNDIWYDYVATCSGELLVTTCSNLGGSAGYDTDLVVYDGTECPVTNDRLLGCNDDDPNNSCGTGAPFASTVRVPIVGGQSYKIRVGGWGPTDSGPGTLLVESTCDCKSTLNLRPSTRINPLGYGPGDEIVVVLEMSDLCLPTAGFQAFLSFDEAELTFVSGDYTAAPFGQPIIDPITAVGGTIDLAAGIDQTIGQTPSDQAAILAELTFTAVAGFCLPESLAFRKHVPPTRLTDATGNAISPLNLTTELPATCKADVNLDEIVDVDDLMAIVMDWGNTDPCNTDTDGNGVVDVDDLIQVILLWGPCP